MEEQQVDRTHGPSRRSVLGGLIGVAAVGFGRGIAEAGKGGTKGGNGKGKQTGKTKVTLCHNPGPQQQTLVVGASAAKAHLAHGDIAGACPPLP